MAIDLEGIKAEYYKQEEEAGLPGISVDRTVILVLIAEVERLEKQAGAEGKATARLIGALKEENERLREAAREATNCQGLCSKCQLKLDEALRDA